MACLSTGLARFAAYSTASLVLALGSSSAHSHRVVQSDPLSDFAAGSLCQASEVVLASCRGHGKIASICSANIGSATYRFGHPGRIELQSTGLHSAQRMYSGGGETQISFGRQGYEYVIFDSTIRTGFDLDGHNNPAFSSGMIVQHYGKTIKAMHCEGNAAAIRSNDLSRYMPEGEFVEH